MKITDVKLTEKNLKTMADQGRQRIDKLIDDAAERLRDPAYRKLNFDFMPGEEKHLLKYLKMMQAEKAKIRAAKERKRREQYYR